MAFSSFFPNSYIAILFALFAITRFENQRWVRARQRGMRGSSQAIGAVVDLTGGLSLLFSLGFLIALVFDFGWKAAVALAMVGLLASIVWSLTSTAFLRGDSLFVWALATIAVWPIAILLAFQISWFGIR